MAPPPGPALIALLCGPYTHSPTTRRPSGRTELTCSTRVPASEGPNVPMSPAMIRREAHIPHGPSGGIAPVMGRNTIELTATAPRDRSDPRAGTPSVMQRSQFNLLTSVNGSAGSSRDPSRCRAGGRSLVCRSSRSALWAAPASRPAGRVAYARPHHAGQGSRSTPQA
ncbi:Uncharacterised protein [Mycobacterium tuberculosis]|nr:Uncharacterised protein [Mycobacterium tuberculosis]